MKRSTLLSIGLVIGLTGCNFISNPSNVQGSDIAKTENRSVAAFDALDVNFAGAIAVHSQEQQSLEISGDDNKASGMGEVNYFGNPTIVNRQTEGIGKINQR